MKPNHKKAAIRDQPEKAKKSVAPAVTRTTQAEAAAELDDIFRSVKQTKPAASKANASSASPQGLSTTTTATATAATVTTVTGEPAPKKQKRDGLYHAPEKNVSMSDAEFFGGSGSSTAPSGGGGSAKGTTSAVEAELLRREGVNRIVSMKDLEKMLSKNPKAGTTPNCPFDCDCCF